MSDFWSGAANESYPEGMFCAAANHLTFAQVLYQENAQQRNHYRLIKEHQALFKRFFRNLGIEVTVNERLGYVAAVPNSSEDFRRKQLTADETRVLIVLRKLYHERMSLGETEDEGRVVVGIEDFVSAYQAWTGREFTNKDRDARAQFDSCKRFGVVRLQDLDRHDDQPFAIRILAGIEAILDFDHCNKLGAAYLAAAAEKQSIEQATAHEDSEADEVPNEDDQETGA